MINVTFESDKDLIKKLKEGEKRRRKVEGKELKKMKKEFEEGREREEKRELLKNASTLQKIKMNLKWALFGYSSKKNMNYSKVFDYNEMQE